MPMSSVSSKRRSPLRFGASAARAIASAALLLAIAAYRVVLRPLAGPACRFAPSCSHYAEQAVREHGPWRGAWLAARRVVRCHPWNPGGYDPVPQRSH
jgi:putative membrane protein insertion efficiency factor